MLKKSDQANHKTLQ